MVLHSSIHNAALVGDLSYVRRFIGDDPNVKDHNNSRTPLHFAAGNGKTETVKYLIEEGGADPNLKDQPYGRTPLHYAARRGKTETVKYLIEEGGADPNVKDKIDEYHMRTRFTPLGIAAEVYADVALQHLKGVRIASTEGINYANENGVNSFLAYRKKYADEDEGINDANENSVNSLLEPLRARNEPFRNFREHDNIERKDGSSYYNINYMYTRRTRLYEIYEDEDVEFEATLEYLITNGCTESNVNDIHDNIGSTRLHIAVKNGKMKIVKSLIENYGADSNFKNVYGVTPLHISAENGQTEITKYLIAKGGADPNVKNIHDKHLAPLHYTAMRGNTELLKYLIEWGSAYPNVTDDIGWTPLHYAAKGGHTKMVRYLVGKGGADPNIVNVEKSFTPLHIAVENEQTKVVECLIENGDTDINVKNRYEVTPLHLAAKSGNIKIVKLITKCQSFNLESLDYKNFLGLTPLDVARENDHTEVVKILEEKRKALKDSFIEEMERIEQSETCIVEQLDQLKNKVSDAQQLKFFYTCTSAASKTRRSPEESSSLINDHEKCTLVKETLESVVKKFHFGGKSRKEFASFVMVLKKAKKDNIIDDMKYEELKQEAAIKDTYQHPLFVSMRKEIYENGRGIDTLKDYVEQLDMNIGKLSDNLRRYQEAVQKGKVRERQFKFFSSLISIATLGALSGVGELGTTVAGFILEHAVDYSDIAEIGEIILNKSGKLEKEFDMDQETQTAITAYLYSVLNDENTKKKISKLMEDEIKDRYEGQPEKEELMRQKASILGMIKTAKIVSEQQSNTPGNLDLLKELLKAKVEIDANRKSIERLKEKLNNKKTNRIGKLFSWR